MKIRYIILSAVGLAGLWAQPLQAQIDRNVEVTKAYVPNIEPTEKLMLTPDMSDDAYIMPDIDYSITPVSIETTFDLTHYNMSRMDFARYTASPRFYLKAGVGLPLQSVVDLYASSFDVDQNFVMGYFNQSGRYANIRNDFSVRHDGSSQSHFRGGLIAGKYIGKRNRLLRGELQYRNDMWSRYATSCDRAYSHPMYQSGELRLEFGDDFASMSGVNFGLRGGVNYFCDKIAYRSTSSDVEALLGGRLLGGDMVANVGYSFVNATRSKVTNGVFELGVNYSRYADKLRAEIGATMYGDNLSIPGGSATYFVPRLMLDYNLSSTALVGYLDLDGALLRNDFASLSDVNPYLDPTTYGDRNTLLYDVNFGFKGVSKDGSFSYDLYIDYEITKGARYWTFVGAPSSINNYFVLDLADLTKSGANIELEYIPRSNTSLRLDAAVASYEQAAQLECGLPTATLRAEWQQQFGAFSTTLSGDYRSSRMVRSLDISTVGYSTQTLDAEFDLGVSLEYCKSDRMRFFLDGRNLLNSDIYDWVNYREYGANVMLGIKMQF